MNEAKSGKGWSWGWWVGSEFRVYPKNNRKSVERSKQGVSRDLTGYKSGFWVETG